MNRHRVMIALALSLLFSIVRCPELSSHQDKEMGLAVVPYSRAVSPNQRNSINPVGGAQSIRPGLGVGLLELGDTRSRALELFKPDADRDISVPFGCGSAFDWVDSENPKVGTVTIRFREGLVFQIDSATTRYRTAEGITTDSSPSRVRRYYRDLRAYVLSNYTDEARGGRPLIYWIDEAKGIAFTFAYSRSMRTRYLFQIIVFEPKTQICSFDGMMNSPDRQELAPYSLEIPNKTKK